MSTTFEKTWNHLWNYACDTSSGTNSWKNMVWFCKAFLCGQLPTYYNGAGVGSAGPPTGAWNVLYSCGLTNNAQAAGATTTIAAGSNGNALPQATINVASTTNFPQGGGFFWVLSSAGPQKITYTGVSGGTQFTGCSGGTGNLATGQNVYDGIDRWSPNTTIGAGSSGASLPQATITVAASGTTGFKSTGGTLIIYTSAGPQTVTYTATSGNTFTGCSGGTGTMTTGGLVMFGSSATNTWDSTNFPGNIVMNSSGSNHSWAWLVSPTALGPVYIFMDVNSASVGIWTIGWSFTAPTGGSTTARPTSTDEVVTSSWNTFTWAPNLITNHIHGSLTTDGMFTLINSNTTVLGSVWIFQKLADAKSADLYPWIMYAPAYQGSMPGPLDGSGAMCTVSYWGARNFNGSALLAQINPYACAISGSNNIMGQSPNMQTTDFTDGLCGDHPLYIFNNAVGAYTIKGRLVDIRGAPCKLAGGFTEPTPTAPLSITFGGSQLGVWLPTYTSMVL